MKQFQDWQVPSVQAPMSIPSYINHCWNCYGPIDSRTCLPSNFGSDIGGYCCPVCGEDLIKWKVRTGRLSQETVNQLVSIHIMSLEDI